MASELNVGGITTTGNSTLGGDVTLAGDGVGNNSEPIIFTNGACAIARVGNDLTLHGYDNVKIGVLGASWPSTTPRLTINSAGLATFSGNTINGGAGGVETFYAHGYSNGNTAWDVDVPCDSDTGSGTVFKVEAGFTHQVHSGFGCLLDAWVTARSTTNISSTEITRVDSTNAGNWSVSRTSNTNFRVSHNAGTYSGSGTWWVKVTYKRA
jgi:hypothetical protein